MWKTTDLGQFTDSGFFTVLWEKDLAVFLPLEFLHEGLPQMRLKAVWKPPIHAEPSFPCSDNLNTALLDLMKRLNICSKERLIRQYDHEVQAATIIKPLIGICNDGPGDAAVS